MSDTTGLASMLTEVLKQNDKGLYTIPGKGLYPHQWLWDSCFIAIGQRHYDAERAKMEILALFRGQWSNGMVPHMIFNDDPDYRTDRNVWRSWLSPYAPRDVTTSGITQPPVLAEAIVRIGERLPVVERRSWYRQVFPNLLAYHEWLYRERDPHGEGLLLQIHPWETGLDNTPPWMYQLHDHLLPGWIRAVRKLRLDTVINWFRRDKLFASKPRYSTIDALAMFDAQRRLRRKAYDINHILTHSLFAIEDVTFNCIFIRANQHLQAIAKNIRHDIPAELLEKMKLTEKSLEELWDPYTEQYYSRDFITHTLIKEPTIGTLMPLYAGCITKERAAKLVKGLESEHIFGAAYPIPSVPLNSPWFDPVGYWQGPTWMNTNWLIIDGLERYGYKPHAEALVENSLEIIEKYGPYEYFDPLTGEGHGAADFSWTAAVALDWLKR